MAEPIRILVVDDEPSLLITLVANLEDCGFVVEGVEDARKALAALRARPFDLVLSDIRMPGMSGVELFGQIKQLQPDLPVVLMTGFAIEKQVEDAVGQGVFAVLPKPFDVDSARMTLESAARRPIVLVLVEGMASSATTIASGLTTIGVRADGVGDTDGALTRVKRGLVDVCVMDLGAPRSVPDGTLEKIKGVDPLLAFIAITPAGGAPLTPRITKEVSSLVRRPFRFKDLLAEIAKARRRGVV